MTITFEEWALSYCAVESGAYVSVPFQVAKRYELKKQR